MDGEFIPTVAFILAIYSFQLLFNNNIRHLAFRYWQTLQGNDLNDGDKFALLYSLHQMGVLGVFSDWPATVTFFGNCFKGKPASKASKGTKKRLFKN